MSTALMLIFGALGAVGYSAGRRYFGVLGALVFAVLLPLGSVVITFCLLYSVRFLP